MKSFLMLTFSFTLFMFSCKSENTTEVTDDTEEVEVMENKYEITPFSPSASFDDAVINEMTFQEGTFNFDIAEGDYKLGVQTPDADQKLCANSAEGQHIHLIVDKEPYAAKYTAEFDYEIPDGNHNILSFLSRSYHESIKDTEAMVAINADIKDNTIVSSSPIEEAGLFYSRPKGKYLGKENTERVMLDFYLVNTDLDADTKVLATINGEEHILDTWQPYYIMGLPMGKNTINLKLVDGDGEMIDTEMNDITREFELLEDIVK